MRKKGDISLTMALALLCTALILCTAGMGGASEAPPAGGPFDGCAMYRTFNDIGAAWREGLITNRDLVLAKTKAFYEERSGVDPTCSTEALEDLKQEVLEDVYRLSHELHQSDKLHLRSLSVDLAEALDRKSVSSVQAQHGTPVDHPTTFERIARALDEGRIGLKESVFLRAELLFAPRMVPPQSKFSPRPGEKVAENYWPIFNRDVHPISTPSSDPGRGSSAPCPTILSSPRRIPQREPTTARSTIPPRRVSPTQSPMWRTSP
jgi:hypothetical protein